LGMKRKEKLEECTYCGKWRELTHDHVPPRCLFSKPRPSDLVTIPCCASCNGEMSKHDEYFRIAITTGIDAAQFPKESAESVRAINSLNRPSSRGFARTLLDSYERNPPRLRIRHDRIEIVLHRIARGLFYHHTNTRLPASIPFTCRLIAGREKIKPIGREMVSRLEKNLRTIGQGNFRYAFERFDVPERFGTNWLMRFYDLRTFLCITVSD
jgi:hypothetical protein